MGKARISLRSGGRRKCFANRVGEHKKNPDCACGGKVWTWKETKKLQVRNKHKCIDLYYGRKFHKVDGKFKSPFTCFAHAVAMRDEITNKDAAETLISLCNV